MEEYEEEEGEEIIAVYESTILTNYKEPPTSYHLPILIFHCICLGYQWYIEHAMYWWLTQDVILTKTLDLEASNEIQEEVYIDITYRYNSHVEVPFIGFTMDIIFSLFFQLLLTPLSFVLISTYIPPFQFLNILFWFRHLLLYLSDSFRGIKGLIFRFIGASLPAGECIILVLIKYISQNSIGLSFAGSISGIIIGLLAGEMFVSGMNSFYEFIQKIMSLILLLLAVCGFAGYPTCLPEKEGISGKSYSWIFKYFYTKSTLGDVLIYFCSGLGLDFLLLMFSFQQWNDNGTFLGWRYNEGGCDLSKSIGLPLTLIVIFGAIWFGGYIVDLIQGDNYNKMKRIVQISIISHFIFCICFGFSGWGRSRIDPSNVMSLRNDSKAILWFCVLCFVYISYSGPVLTVWKPGSPIKNLVGGTTMSRINISILSIICYSFPRKPIQCFTIPSIWGIFLLLVFSCFIFNLTENKFYAVRERSIATAKMRRNESEICDDLE